MSLILELANEIWNEDAFHADLNQLEAANLRVQLHECGIVEEAGGFNDALLRRMTQAALIFSETGDERYQSVAQRISTSTLRLAGPIASDLFTLIQGRLRNFPALRTSPEIKSVPAHAPMSLQYEFIGRKIEQTIIASDKSAHILTPFQLKSWSLLHKGQSGTISGPTSAGKSYILLLHLVERFKLGLAKTAAYVVPTRALINQVSDDTAAAFSDRGIIDISITSIPVDIQPEGGKVIYVVTQERLDVLLTANPDIKLDLVIIDEAQMIADGSRGVLLESVLDRIDADKQKSQIVFSGPLIENPDYFGKIFNLSNFATSFASRTPVTQNIIFLNYLEQPDPIISARLLTEKGSAEVTNVKLPIRLLADLDRLSYISLAFGKSGSSIVYAAGKADAEKIATKIAIDIPKDPDRSKALSELINFVKKHVHKDYVLVSTLEKGVGFHYGQMPSLLRKQLEDYFRDRKIHFLVCTSTLLYGLNLPARNIFLQKPTMGRGRAISGPAFWNLSGRVGRLGKELEGNVFLIDYAKWESNPISEGRRVFVTSALSTTIADQSEGLLSFLDDSSVSSDTNPEFEITLGKLVLDNRLGRLNRTLERYALTANAENIEAIRRRVERISEEINIPTDVLNSNIGVSLFRQNDLLAYMLKRLKEIPAEEMILSHPLGTFNDVLSNHRRAFKRIHTYLLNYAGRDGSHNFFAPLALRWMRGDPLPVLIDSSIKYYRSKRSTKPTAAIIRETMENVEKSLRFKYVKYFTAYNSLLKVALMRSDYENYVDLIPDIPLFLEVGGSSGAMINLMALGLSRTSAESLSDYITNKEISLPELRAWLREIDVTKLDISPICMREIQNIIK